MAEETKRVSKSSRDTKVAGIIDWYCNVKGSLPYDAVMTLHAYNMCMTLGHVAELPEHIESFAEYMKGVKLKTIVILTIK